MIKTMCAAAMVLTIFGASAIAGRPEQNDSVPRLNSRIGATDPQRYKTVRDPKNWENPCLVIRRDGIEVIAKGLPSGRQIVATAELRRTLIELPVAAWPYGRVVAVQKFNARALDGSDEKPIDDNLIIMVAFLKGLEVTIEKWPGGQ